MTQQIDSITLDNGLRVVVQTMRGVQSAAFSLMIPAGAVRDAIGKSGTTALLAEMLPRGAGERTARELSSGMDNLGLQRNISGGVRYLNVSAATTADRLASAIPLMADMVLRPHLSEDQFPAARALVEQGLHALEDEPRQRLGHQLRRCAYPAPYGNPAEGTLEDVPAITLEDLESHHRQYVVPSDSVIGIAGNVTMDDVRPVIEDAFGNWDSREVIELAEGNPGESPFHVETDSAQTQIGLAWDSVPYQHEKYFESWAANSILSGGMSSRLFTEVREKRGLCYAISASINSQIDRAKVFGYAGTTPERAQETLDAMVAEVLRLDQGLTESELQRCQARAKSTLIMQQESTMSRSGSLARDTLYLGRVRSMEEIRTRVDELTIDAVREYLAEYGPKHMVLVTIGPEALNSDCLPQLASTAG